jgi:deoxyribose-phosphate aldolase
MLAAADMLGRIDRSFWKPDATVSEIERLCLQAREQKVRAVCVSSSRVELVAARLEDSGIKTVGLVGFPLGGMHGDAKRFEAEAAIDFGAQELEVVINLGLLKDGSTKAVLRELRDVAETADELPVCVAIEMSLLTRDQAVLAAHLILDSGASCLASASGFWAQIRAQAEDIQLLREALGPKFELKAAGAIADPAAAQALLAAGATRLGISGSSEPATL